MAESTKVVRRKTTTPIDNTYGHLQPQALDFERVVLGALMIDKDAFSIISEMIRPETFYEPRHQKIYTAIQTLNMNENPVDIMTVTDELKREGTLDAVGGAAYIVELSSNVASSANIEYHARILAQKFLARQLISFASVIETKAFDETVDVEELMQEAEGSLFELSQRNMKKDYVQVDPVIAKAVEILQKASANNGGLTGVPTGYTKLDEKTSGWQNSDLVIIAGRPAMGKTSFALNLAQNITMGARKRCVFFSLEMTKEQLAERLLASQAGIESQKFRTGELTDDEWIRLGNALSSFHDVELYLDDTAAITVPEIKSIVRRLKGVDCILIDYLGLIQSAVHKENRVQEVSEITRNLKMMAKDLNIPVICCAQLSRGTEGRGKTHTPQLSDLRESGSIEQDADIVMFLYRPDYYRNELSEEERDEVDENLTELIVAKNRHGGVGTIQLTFDKEFTRFRAIDNVRDYNQG